MTRYLIAIDLNDADLAAAYPEDPQIAGHAFDDLAVSIGARLGEVFAGRHDAPVRGTLAAMCSIGDDTLPDFISATEVGAEGIEDDNTRSLILGSCATMRGFQYFGRPL
jgi:hypothetical protein